MPPTAALADTGGSGGGDGGPGEGGSANPARRVYLSVYDHVGVTVDPVTALPHAEQGWGSDSIAFFLQQAEDRLAVGAGPGHYLGFNGDPAFDNGMNLEEFITHQCTKALDEATARNPRALASRVVALQFSYQVYTADLGNVFEHDYYHSVSVALVEPALWRDTTVEAGGFDALKRGTWSDQRGNVTADTDGDGVYDPSEYVNHKDPAPRRSRPRRSAPSSSGPSRWRSTRPGTPRRAGTSPASR